nr:hypothetical protein [Rhodococcus qingshengii]
MNESLMTVMVEVHPAVDVGEHSIKFVWDCRRRIVKNTEIAWHGVDGADLTSPLVEVTEQVPMDGLQVREIETPVDRSRGQLRHSRCRNERFGPCERVRISTPEPVSQNHRSRTVKVVAYRGRAGGQFRESAGDCFVPGDLAVQDSAGCGFGLRGERAAAHFKAGADACYFPFDLTSSEKASRFT